MATPANLDAFIPRDDFLAESDHPNIFDEQPAFGMVELKESLFTLLRKPDFQRETAAWDPERIKEFIKSFVNGDLIPAVIFWGSPTTGNIFVVDGAHRLSALLAWLHDDYGDKDISQKFFDFRPNADQLKAAVQTRSLIDFEVGSYSQITNAETNPDASPKHQELCPMVKRRRISVQWIKGDASKAEDSFYKINLQSVRLEKTELHLIKSRDFPNAVATRAIVRAGTGHKYWKKFKSPYKEETERYAKDINTILFNPPLSQPVRTLELPFGGQPYGGDGMRLTLELVELANKTSKTLKDTEGARTVSFLQRTWTMATRICGSDMSALGLHPAVYVYSHATGKHQPAAFMAVVRWINDLELRKYLEKFCAVRRNFEEFLIENEHLTREIVSKKGSRSRSVPSVIAYYQFVLDRMLEGDSNMRVLDLLKHDDMLGAFWASASASISQEFGPDFSKEVKSQVYIREALSGAVRCNICGARLYPRVFTTDHTLEKRNAGKGSPDNAQLAHYYCNSNKDNILQLANDLRSQKVATLIGVGLPRPGVAPQDERP